MKDNMICNKEPIKIEEITRGNIIYLTKVITIKFQEKDCCYQQKNIYSYVIYRNSIDNTLSYIEQEEILQAIIDYFSEKGQKIIVE